MAMDYATVNETDFYLNRESLDGITHLLLVNGEGASTLPSILVASAIQGNEPIGYITSKHAFVQPHRILDEVHTMWPVFRVGTTAFVCVNSSTVISHTHGAQRNEWLFNYPPCRDIADNFSWIEHFGILTTFALNRLFDKPYPDFESMRVDVEDLGTEVAPESLQGIWGWLPAHLYGMMSDGTASIFIMPSESVKPSKSLSMSPADFKGMCELLRENGFSIPENTEESAQDSYIGITSEALERVKELMGSQIVKDESHNGGMFQ